MWHRKLRWGFNLKRSSRMVLVICGGGLVVVVACVTSKLRVVGALLRQVGAHERPEVWQKYHKMLQRRELSDILGSSLMNNGSTGPDRILHRAYITCVNLYSCPRARNYKMCQCIWLTRLFLTVPSDWTPWLLTLVNRIWDWWGWEEVKVMHCFALHYSKLKLHRIYPLVSPSCDKGRGAEASLSHLFGSWLRHDPELALFGCSESALSYLRVVWRTLMLGMVASPGLENPQSSVLQKMAQQNDKHYPGGKDTLPQIQSTKDFFGGHLGPIYWSS